MVETIFSTFFTFLQSKKHQFKKKDTMYRLWKRLTLITTAIKAEWSDFSKTNRRHVCGILNEDVIY